MKYTKIKKKSKKDKSMRVCSYCKEYYRCSDANKYKDITCDKFKWCSTLKSI